MSNLKVTVIQSDLIWEDHQGNRDAFQAKINALEDTPDLIVLPEMFNTGFSMESSKLAEQMDGPTVQWMRAVAAQKSCVVTGSIIVEERGQFFNRMLWMRPDGTHEHYDKRHLFRMAGEHEHFSPGERKTIVELKGWKICLQVCYDLRFPVYVRNRNEDRYDAILYVANWPAARSNAWSTLLLARAIENQCYVVGVNRVGEDGKGIAYSGDSVIVDPKGQVMSHLIPSQEGIETMELDLSALNEFREKFPVGLDADEFDLR